MTHTPESLIQFERKVAAAFEAKQIHAPVHLCSDEQAAPLIDIFKDVRPEDWVFCTWRSHFHALLKGMPEDELFAQIVAGRSMFVMSRERRVVSSAIVGGILPVALGVAMGIKEDFRRATVEDRKECRFASYQIPMVWVFVGDMARTTGLFKETVRYSRGHRLPIRFIVENNGMSTNASTDETWGPQWNQQPWPKEYQYTRNWPHVGTGTRVRF